MPKKKINHVELKGKNGNCEIMPPSGVIPPPKVWKKKYSSISIMKL
jgi:hypothetical protein